MKFTIPKMLHWFVQHIIQPALCETFQSVIDVLIHLLSTSFSIQYYWCLSHSHSNSSQIHFLSKIIHYNFCYMVFIYFENWAHTSMSKLNQHGYVCWEIISIQNQAYLYRYVRLIPFKHMLTKVTEWLFTEMFYGCNGWYY